MFKKQINICKGKENVIIEKNGSYNFDDKKITLKESWKNEYKNNKM